MYMKKIFLLAAAVSLFYCHAVSQTLFTYGKYTVDAKDFLRAFNKNNSAPAAGREKAIREYLELYVKSRLKVQEAYDRKYDTLPYIKNEVANLRTQIAENYMTDPVLQERLVSEAFQRSQKDVHVAHIFISSRNATGFIDSAAAVAKRDEIIRRLEKGEDFMLLAQQTSDDPSAKTNRGDLGYITVFTLPYDFENVIYKTATGKYSAPVSSKIGWHIFKNLGERKAVGKIKAQQILLAIPPNADEKVKKQIAARADSLYKRLMAGENFNRLAAAFSNDYISGAAGGIMPDIGVGQYDPVFESVLWSLAKDNAVSKPFQTTHGWHIVKRLSLKPVITDAQDRINRQDILQKIIADSRWQASGDFVLNQVKAKARFKRFPYDEAAVWNMTDSVLDLKPMLANGRTIIATTPLFSIGDSVYNATHWVNYANTYRFKQDGSGAKPHSQVRDEWEKFAMRNYFKDHLEFFNDDFRYQMGEFKDGNLFFEIMQQEVWNRAQADTAALLALYQKNKKNYTWKQSADAIIFFCSDETTAKAAWGQLKKNPADWKKVAEQYTEKVIADSSRFEWDQIPSLGKTVPKKGMFTAPVLNKTDNTASFAYIINVFTTPLQRSFSEARGLVISDYQAILEQQLDEALKKKYPVVIDQKMLAEISK